MIVIFVAERLFSVKIRRGQRMAAVFANSGSSRATVFLLSRGRHLCAATAVMNFISYEINLIRTLNNIRCCYHVYKRDFNSSRDIDQTSSARVALSVKNAEQMGRAHCRWPAVETRVRRRQITLEGSTRD